MNVQPPSTVAKASAAPAGILRPLLRFTAAQGVLIALMAFAITTWLWTDPESVRAVRLSAWLAFGVQILTFIICKLIARTNFLAGWGIGVFLRFATVAVWAFLGLKALGLSSTPALFSLVGFFFVSTVIEPLFLNS